LKKILFLFCLLFSSNLLWGEELILKTCSDENKLFPNLMQDKNEIIGSYVDILNEVVKNLNNKLSLNIEYNMIPWARCLELLKQGKMDAALAASYNDERSLFLYYPPDAGPNEEKPCASKNKIRCSQYDIITLKSQKIIFTKDLHSLPSPIRATRSYSIVEELKKMGLEVDIAKNEELNVKRMIRDKNGCVIAYHTALENILNNKDMLEKIDIQEVPAVVKSYYLAFSKKSNFTEAQRLLIWTEIGNISNNQTLVKKFEAKYEPL